LGVRVGSEFAKIGGDLEDTIGGELLTVAEGVEYFLILQKLALGNSSEPA
jgi:hypothetical protein